MKSNIRYLVAVLVTSSQSLEDKFNGPPTDIMKVLMPMKTTAPRRRELERQIELLRLCAFMDFLGRMIIALDQTQNLPAERRLLTRADPINYYSDSEFKMRFRMEKDSVIAILEEVSNVLEPPSMRNRAISPLTQLLLTLRMYATGTFFTVMGDFMGVSRSSAHRIVHKVSLALCGLRNEAIRMPESLEERRKAQRDAFSLSAFPKVVGLVDGTHIRITSQGGDQAEIFRNRKGYFSINVQCVVGGDLKILDVFAGFPGSAHDATIFNSSTIKARFDNGEFGDLILLGDSAYALTKYMLTPIPDPVTQAEQLYNEHHIRTRNAVERAFGIWKRRFPIIALGTQIKLDNLLPIITSTIVLNNLLRDLSDAQPPDDPALDIDWDQVLAPVPLPQLRNRRRTPTVLAQAEAVRQRFISYFEN